MSFDLQGKSNDLFLYEMKNWSETGYICFSRSATRTFGTFQNIRTFQPENLIPFSISGNEILANFVDI